MKCVDARRTNRQILRHEAGNYRPIGRIRSADAPKYMKFKDKYRKKDYVIKNECACCGKTLDNNWKRFKKYGNYCFNCDLKSEIISKIRGKLVFIERFKDNTNCKKDVLIIENEINLLKEKLVKRFNILFDDEIKKAPIEFIESLIKQSIWK